MHAKFLAKQKFRFDVGQGFLAVINFAFLVIAASDKLGTLTHLSAKAAVCIFVPVAVVLVWLIGLMLDKVKFVQAYQEEQNQRNVMLTAVHRVTTGETIEETFFQPEKPVWDYEI